MYGTSGFTFEASVQELQQRYSFDIKLENIYLIRFFIWFVCEFSIISIIYAPITFLYKCNVAAGLQASGAIKSKICLNRLLIAALYCKFKRRFNYFGGFYTFLQRLFDEVYPRVFFSFFFLPEGPKFCVR